MASVSPKRFIFSNDFILQLRFRENEYFCLILVNKPTLITGLYDSSANQITAFA